MAWLACARPPRSARMGPDPGMSSAPHGDGALPAAEQCVQEALKHVGARVRCQACAQTVDHAWTQCVGRVFVAERGSHADG